MVQGPYRNESRWQDRLSRSGFFLGALLLHLIVFIMVATWLIYPPTPQPTPDTVTLFRPVSEKKLPMTVTFTNNKALDVSSLSSTSSVSVIHTGVVGDAPPIKIDVGTPGISDAIDNGPEDPRIFSRAPAPVEGISGPRLQEISDTVRDKWGMTPEQIANNDPTCKFPVYVATYANGDWACNTRLDKDGNIVAGSMPNLAAKIKEWSHGSIQAQVVPKPLNIGGPELLDKMPPFIFFTGHKDFVLTQEEVDNLAKYLEKGGAIWGDNALAGSGSRFDVAFRREMKRVVPDQDFAPMTLNDDIFTKSHYSITEVPRGMNYYDELPQHIDIDGVLAILYTPNDYSDMLFMRVLPGDQEVYVKDEVPPNTLYTEQKFWYSRDVFYRNFDLNSTLAVHRLGMNIVNYLLVRFDPYLLTP